MDESIQDELSEQNQLNHKCRLIGILPDDSYFERVYEMFADGHTLYQVRETLQLPHPYK